MSGSNGGNEHRANALGGGGVVDGDSLPERRTPYSPKPAPASENMELGINVPAELLDRIAEAAASIVLAELREAQSPESEYLTVPEAAELLRAKPQRVYDLLSDGRLTRHKDGARVLVSRAELVSHLLPTGSRVRIHKGIAA